MSNTSDTVLVGTETDAELEVLIDQCMGRDRPRLRRQLASCQPKTGRCNRHPRDVLKCDDPRSPRQAADALASPDTAAAAPDSDQKTRARGRLLAAIEASLQRAQARRRQRPAITYPDHLPICARRDDIAAAVREHQVVVVAGATGSGKTTQLPKICLELGRGITGQIGHTQPRRLAARMVASRVAEELGTTPGDVVGFQIRFQDHSGDDTLVKVMTDGILLAEIPHDRLLNRYDTLIIDEAHERSLNIDFLLGYLKSILPRRPDLKLIITSATIDVERFSRHFDRAPIIEVSGRSYPVEVRYRPPVDDEPDLYGGIVAAVAELLAEAGGGDILVFLSGEREIREAATALRNAAVAGGRWRHLEILPLYARLSSAEQDRVFGPHSGTRVVLATNVAETSLTVPGIRYVVDTGRVRISRYSYRTKVQRLPVEPISRASADQRAGRCGRLANGICIRLYAEDDYRDRPAFTDPELLRTNLAGVILQMLNLRIGDVRRFPFVDPPDRRFLNDGFQLLRELGAVSAAGELTAIGRQLCLLPLDPRLARMLLAAAQERSLKEVLVIVSALSIQDPRERPADKRQLADERHRQWLDRESDFSALLSLWNHFEAQRQALSRNQFAAYCRQQFVSVMRMREWRDLHHQVHLACRNLGLRDNDGPADYAAIHRAVLTGLLSQIGLRAEGREFLGTRQRRFLLFPGSGLSPKPPAWVMSAELLETSRLFAHHNAAIAPQWLPGLAADLVKKTHSEPRYDPRRGQVIAWERQTLYGLAIVERKAVPFAPIDPHGAREVFIQQALVEGRYGVKDRGRGSFAAANRALLAQLQDLEERLRRRDILADERELYRFYEERIPAEIASLATFEDWRKRAERTHPDLLVISRERLLRAVPGADIEAQFPREIDCGGHRYLLRYRFEPGHAEDGVSIEVPVGMLHQVPQHRFEWLVPGLLRDKLIALVRGLPKNWRTHFVPVPDCVDRVLGELEPVDQPLLQVFGQALRDVLGVAVPPDAWRPELLEAFYRVNFRLLDERGQLLAQGRDLTALRAQYRQTVQDTISAAAGFERDHLQRWDFDELPEETELQRDNLVIRAYPALVADSGGVSLRAIDSPRLANTLSRRGVVRLAMLEAADAARYLRRQLLRGKELLLAAAQLPERSAVVEELIYAAYRCAIFADRPLPRRRQTFEAYLLAGRGGIVATANDSEQWLLALMPELTALHALLRQRERTWPDAVADGREQLSALFAQGMLANTASHWLRQYPRYVRALATRFEKLPGQYSKDHQAIARLNLLRQDLRDFSERVDDCASAVQADIEEFRFLIEEYRVSLFAQQLKTVLPVSEPRLLERARRIRLRLGDSG